MSHSRLTADNGLRDRAPQYCSGRWSISAFEVGLAEPNSDLFRDDSLQRAVTDKPSADPTAQQPDTRMRHTQVAFTDCHRHK